MPNLNLAYDMGACEVTCKNDSQLVVRQIKGYFEVKEPLLQRYYHTILNLISQFFKVNLEHIQREENVRVDALSQLASAKKKNHHRPIIQISLKVSSIGLTECLVTTEGDTWMTSIKNYIEFGMCKLIEKKTTRQHCARLFSIKSFSEEAILDHY